MSNPFLTGLSGLNAAKTQISVISNNISNTETTAFKTSSVRFGDIYTGFQGATGFKTDGGAKAVGGGVHSIDIIQKFDQGTINSTDRELDVAVNGQGLLQFTDNNGAPILSRNGSLDIDKDGYIVNPLGYRLNVFTVDDNGELTSSIGDIKLAKSKMPPNATSEIKLGANLSSDAPILDPLAFDKLDPKTYSFSTSTTVFDSLGGEHLLTSYYIKSAANEWKAAFTMDGNDLSPNGAGPGGQVTLQFDSLGSITSVDGDPNADLTFDPYAYGNGSDDFVSTMNLSEFTQFANDSVISSSYQNGNSTGDLSGISINSKGVIATNFNNGARVIMGQIILVNLNNPAGLKQEGDGMYSVTVEAGTPLIGTPGNGDFGEITSGNLEGSNVELATELVGLISSQRYYQANSKSISTWDQLLQETIRLGG